MAAEEVPAIVTNYWAPVSQIVPVLGLAFVLEARRLAGRWRENAVVYRVALSMLFVLAAWSLWTVEWWALNATSNGVSVESEVALSRIALTTSVSALAVQPLVNLFVTGNTDFWMIAWRIWPWSRWARYRRNVHKAERMARLALVKIRATRKDAKELVIGFREQQKMLLAQQRVGATAPDAAVESEATDSNDEITAVNSDIDARIQSVAANLDKLLTARKEGRRLQRKAKRNLKDVLALKDGIKFRVLDDHERAAAEAAIDRYLGVAQASVQSANVRTEKKDPPGSRVEPNR